MKTLIFLFRYFYLFALLIIAIDSKTFAQGNNFKLEGNNNGSESSRLGFINYADLKIITSDSVRQTITKDGDIVIEKKLKVKSKLYSDSVLHIASNVTIDSSLEVKGSSVGFTNGGESFWWFPNQVFPGPTHDLLRVSTGYFTIMRGGKKGTSTPLLGMGMNTETPQSLLHQHQSVAIPNYHQWTNSTTGATVGDGLRIGIEANGLAEIIQQENNMPVQFFLKDINFNNALIARAELTSGNQMVNGGDGLRLWNPGYNNSAQYAPRNALDLWVAPSNSTHIRMDNSGSFDGQNNQQEISARLRGFWLNASPTISQYNGFPINFRARYIFNIDSLEVMRIGTGVGMNGTHPNLHSNNPNEGWVRIGEQTNPAVPVNAGNRLEVDAFPNTTFSSGNPLGGTGFSGLRLTDLTSNSIPVPSANFTPSGFLSVDQNGDVILVPDGGGGANLFGYCSPGPVLMLTGDAGTNLNDKNFYFEGQGTTNGSSNVGMGYNCGSALTAKLDVLQNNGLQFTTAIKGTSNNAWSQIGVNGVVNDANRQVAVAGFASIAANIPNPGNFGQTAGSFNASGPGSNTGIFVYANGLGNNSNNVAGDFKSSGNGPQNYGIRTLTDAATQNIGIYSWVPGTVPPSAPPFPATDLAGLFAGDIWISSQATGSGFLSPSDILLKKDTASFNQGINVIRNMHPISFRYNGKAGFDTTNTHTGIIAEDLALIAPYAIDTLYARLDTGDEIPAALLAVKNEAIMYTSINAIKQLDSAVIALQNAGGGSVNAANGLHSDAGTVKLGGSLIEDTDGAAILYQNMPNPFGDGTTIRYFVPEKSASANIIFYDNFGNEIKNVELSNKGQTAELNLSTFNLASGIYSYSLVVNGKIVDTKKMIKSK